MRRRALLAGLAAAALAVGVAGGCSDGGRDAAPPATTAPPEAPPTTLATVGDPLAPGTADGSPARAHQEVAAALTEAGVRAGPTDPERITEVSRDDRGRAVSFLIDGRPLAEVLHVGGPSVGQGGVVAHTAYALDAPGPDGGPGLWLVVEVANQAVVPLEVDGAAYPGRGGEAIPTEPAPRSPASVPATSTDRLVLWAPGGAFGGQLAVDGHLGGGPAATPVSLAVPVD